MNESIQGLVLKSIDYREYDALVTFLTREYGKLTFIAKGVRRMSSRNASSLLPYTKTEISFDYRPERSLFRLKTARTSQLYRYLHEDLAAGTAAAAISEIADKFSLEGENHSTSQLFDLVEAAFSLLNQKKNTNIILALFIGDIMRMNGIEPNVDACVHDGNVLVSAISVHEGGFLCESCARRYGEKIRNASELHLFRLIVKAGIQRYQVIDEKTDISWCLKILEDMLSLQGNVTIRSFRLYNEVNQVD